MNATDAAHRLADRLILEEEFSPLSRLLPGMESVAAACSAVVARPESGNMVLHALLGLAGHDAEDLSRLAAWLRDSAEEASPRVRGRVVVCLVIIHAGPLDPALADALDRVEGGGMMARVLLARMSVDCLSGQARVYGRVEPRPDRQWYSQAVLEPAHAVAGEVEEALVEREREQVLIRAWFRPGPTWVVWSIVAVNVAVFLYQQALANQVGEGASMVALGTNSRNLTVGESQWWRLGASMFLHFGPLHLAANMFSLYSLGSFLERLVGHARFFSLYIGCGLFASAASLANLPVGVLPSGEALYAPSAGASGAVFAVAGALLSLKFRCPPQFPPGLAERLFRSLGKPVLFLIGGGILWSVVVRTWGLRLPQLDNFAHLGGLLAGFLSMILWPAQMREKFNLQA